MTTAIEFAKGLPFPMPSRARTSGGLFMLGFTTGLALCIVLMPAGSDRPYAAIDAPSFVGGRSSVDMPMPRHGPPGF